MREEREKGRRYGEGEKLKYIVIGQRESYCYLLICFD